MKCAAERFAALMEGALPDRVPVVCNLLDQGGAELGMEIREYYADGKNVAAGQLSMREKYGYDSVMGSFYGALEAEMLGCRTLVYATDGPPNVGHLVIGGADDIDRLEIPADLTAHPRFREELECIRTLKRESAGRFPVLATVNGSFTLPSILMGMERWMRLFLTGSRELAGAILEKCSDFCVRRTLALKEAGADMIAYVNPLGSATFLRESQFRELALPWIIRDLEGFGAEGMVYFNGGGCINPFLSTLCRETSFGAYYINALDDVAQAKEILHGRALLAAPINDIKLIYWTAAQIEAEVARIMAAGMPGGGFIFGTLVMPCYIAPEKIRCMLEAAYRHGSYQGRG